MLQFFVILAGLVPLTIVGLKAVGGWSGLQDKIAGAKALGPLVLQLWEGTGAGNVTNPIGADWIAIVFGLGFVLSFGYWTTNFAEVQRALAAKNLSAARRTPLIAAFPKMLIPLIVVVPGPIAAVTVRGLGAKTGDLQYNNAVPILISEYLPNGMLGIAITGLLAAFMAGVAANVTAFNTVVSYDLWQAYVRRDEPDEYYIRSESNRRPHPYHGTTGNRCADRRLPKSPPTVGAEVTGSLLAKACDLYKECAALSLPWYHLEWCAQLSRLSRKDRSMRVAVIGAGAIGSVIGGLLARAHEDVTLIGRRPHVDAVNRNGLRIDGALGTMLVRVRAAERLDFRPDLALLTVKTQGVAATAQRYIPSSSAFQWSPCRTASGVTSWLRTYSAWKTSSAVSCCSGQRFSSPAASPILPKASWCLEFPSVPSRNGRERSRRSSARPYRPI